MLFHSLLLGLSLALSSTGMARSVYVNGIDVSSARNQLMESVTVRIDREGNVFIEAPQYQVHEESTYIPLKSYNDAHPTHRSMSAVPNDLKQLPPANPKTSPNQEDKGAAPALNEESRTEGQAVKAQADAGPQKPATKDMSNTTPTSTKEGSAATSSP